MMDQNKEIRYKTIPGILDAFFWEKTATTLLIIGPKIGAMAQKMKVVVSQTQFSTQVGDRCQNRP